MKITKRKILGSSKYQYLYDNGFRIISLVYLETARHGYMWETLHFNGFNGGNLDYNKRFDTQDEAEDFIREILLGDDLGSLVEWKMAKRNMGNITF